MKKLNQKIGRAIEIASTSVSVAVISTSGFGYCFYFRYVPDGVLHSRTVSTQVEADRVCPKAVVAAEITLKCVHVA